MSIYESVEKENMNNMNNVDELIATYRKSIKLTNCFSFHDQYPYMFLLFINVIFIFMSASIHDYKTISLLLISLAIILFLFIKKEIRLYSNFKNNIVPYLYDSIIHYNLTDNITDVINYIDILLEIKSHKKIFLSKYYSYIIIPSIVSLFVGIGINNDNVLGVYIFFFLL